MNWRETFNRKIVDSEEIASLNKVFSEYTGAPFSIALSNGTHAIEVALKAFDLPPGSKVLVPSISFIATAVAVANCGFVPVYYDYSCLGKLDSLESIQSVFTQDVSCVIVVHFAGIVNRQILDIAEFCRSEGVYLIEDCAQAFGARYAGKHVGNFGNAGTFSFQSSKLVEAGEGGMIVCNSSQIARRCERIINWGLSKEKGDRYFAFTASNYRISGVQAYILNMQLDRAAELVAAHKKLVAELIEKWEHPAVSPVKDPQAFDVEFFLITENPHLLSGHLHPLDEYPMFNSNLVYSIIAKQFPGNLESYSYNANKAKEHCGISSNEIRSLRFLRVKEASYGIRIL
jgi:perosamine synthetase